MEKRRREKTTLGTRAGAEAGTRFLGCQRAEQNRAPGAQVLGEAGAGAAVGQRSCGGPVRPTGPDTPRPVSSGAPNRRRGKAGPDAGTREQRGGQKRWGCKPAGAGGSVPALVPSARDPGQGCDLSAWHELSRPEEALRCKREPMAWGPGSRPEPGSYAASPSPTRASRLAGVQWPRRSAQRL